VLPLPGVVMFPHAALPVHVSELRYRTLVRDALSGERVLALATLKPGWERDDPGSPPFHDLGCLASFEQVEWLPNDSYDLRLRGVDRVRFGVQRREFPYRACDVERLPSTPYDDADPLAQMERHALLAAARRLMPRGAAVWWLPPVTSSEASLEVVVNTLALGLRLAPAAKLEMLALDSVYDRARLLRDHLDRARATPSAEGGEEAGRN